jgi:hypothetical protein
MINISECGAQGDVFFLKLDAAIPRTAKRVEAVDGRHVLAQGDSASGEHFVAARGVALLSGDDDRTAYLRIEAPGVEVVHGRAADQHESLFLAPGDWLVRRQREHTPDGFRRVED